MATKKTPQQIGRSSRQKGARGEREVCNALKEAFPGEEFRRGYQRRVQSDEPDVVGPAWFNFWAECKNTKAPNIVKAYHQAKDEAAGPGISTTAPRNIPPLVFSKKTNDPSGWLVTMDLKTFLSVLKVWKEHS